MITAELARTIADRIEALGVGEETLSALRKEHPQLHFTYCLDDDIPHYRPVVERRQFNIYLVDGRDHCLSLTNHLQAATGLVLAEVIEE